MCVDEIIIISPDIVAYHHPFFSKTLRYLYSVGVPHAHGSTPLGSGPDSGGSIDSELRYTHCLNLKYFWMTVLLVLSPSSDELPTASGRSLPTVKSGPRGFPPSISVLASSHRRIGRLSRRQITVFQNSGSMSSLLLPSPIKNSFSMQSIAVHGSMGFHLPIPIAQNSNSRTSEAEFREYMHICTAGGAVQMSFRWLAAG